MSFRGADPLRLASAAAVILTLLAAPHRTHGTTARSTSYALEYATVCAAAGEAESAGGTYSMVSQATTEGVAGQCAASADYSLEPALGAPANTAAAADWMLY